jgi:hypothetical protein
MVVLPVEPYSVEETKAIIVARIKQQYPEDDALAKDVADRMLQVLKYDPGHASSVTLRHVLKLLGKPPLLHITRC